MYKRKEDSFELGGEIKVISAPVYSRAEHNVGRTLRETHPSLVPKTRTTTAAETREHEERRENDLYYDVLEKLP